MSQNESVSSCSNDIKPPFINIDILFGAACFSVCDGEAVCVCLCGYVRLLSDLLSRTAGDGREQQCFLKHLLCFSDCKFAPVLCAAPWSWSLRRGPQGKETVCFLERLLPLYIHVMLGVVGFDWSKIRMFNP